MDFEKDVTKSEADLNLTENANLVSLEDMKKRITLMEQLQS